MADTLPFNSINHDRVYKAEDWMWYFATFLANGVFPKPSDGLQVIAYEGMEIRVNMGYAFINGAGYGGRRLNPYRPYCSALGLDRAGHVLSNP